MKLLIIFVSYLLFGFMLVKSIFIWKDCDKEILLFGMNIRLKKIFRIEREMLGAHRKPYGLFFIFATLGLIILFSGLPFQSALLFKAGAMTLGLSFIIYGSYGFYKKEIVPIYAYGINRSYGSQAFIDALISITLGVGALCLLLIPVFENHK